MFQMSSPGMRPSNPAIIVGGSPRLMRARWTCGESLLRPTPLADALVDPLEDEIGDLQVVLVLHDHVTVAADAASRSG